MLISEGDTDDSDVANDSENEMQCGNFPPSDKNPDDVHCNRKIGPTLDFGCISCDNVTIFRIGKDCRGKFRFFIADGKVLDKPKQFNGTSVVVQTKNSAEKIVNESVLEGWEPHFVVAYGDIAKELTTIANMLNIDINIW